MRYGAGVALCLAAFTAPVLADPAGEAFLADQIAALDADPDWKAAVASVSSSGAETIVGGLTFEMASPLTIVSAQEARIENLVPGEDQTFTFTGAKITDLRIKSPTLSLVVPSTEPGQEPETLAIGSLEVGGVRFLDAEGFGAISDLPPDADPAQRDLAMQEALDALPKLGHLAMADVKLGNSTPLNLASFRVDVEDYLGPIPLPWSAEMTDLTLPGIYVRSALKHFDPRVAQIFTLLDSEIFVIDASGGEAWVDPEKGEVRATARATVNDAAAIDITYTYSGANEAWLASVAGEAVLGNFRQALESFEDGVMLNGMTIRISDRALLDQIFGAVAEALSLGVDGAAYRKQISMFALPLFMLTVGKPEYTEAFLKPLQEFVGDGRTLVIQLQPAEPVSAEAIAAAMNRDPESLLALLNLTMTTEDSAALQ